MLGKQADRLSKHHILVIMLLMSVILGSCDRPTSQLTPSSSPSLAPESPTPITLKSTSAADRAKASALRQKGLNYRNQKQYQQAIAALQKAVELDPSNLGGRIILGWTFHLAGQETEATQQLKQVLALDPNNVPALNALGIVYLVGGNLTAAVETHEKAILLKPDNEIGYYNLSLAYQRLKRYPEAISKAKRATQLEPNNPHPWIALAIAHWSNNEPSLARAAYRQGIRLNARYRQSRYLKNLKLAGFSPDQIQLTDQVRKSQ
jgi:Flp pilus assembly protein TadD